MRQNLQKIGIIAILIIAGISLPLGIMGFTREPIVNNYYTDNYYYYYNQTWMRE